MDPLMRRTPVSRHPAAIDANAADRERGRRQSVAAPVNDTLVTEEAVETGAGEIDDDGGFPVGRARLLGLLGLIPRLRR